MFLRSLASLCLAAACSLALAQGAVHYKENEQVDPQEVARILDARPMKLRSIRLTDDDGPVQAAAPTALSLPVRFAFDSAQIAPSARVQLDALAEGVKLLPPQRGVQIDGHTDAVGNDAYNQQLSQRRAVAVKQYLVQVHGIDAARLQTAGYGKSQPIEGSSAYAPENRRVQFRGL